MSAMTRQSMMRGVEAGTVAGPALGKKSQAAALSRKSVGEALGRKSQRFGGRRNTPYESARARMNWQNAVRLVRLSYPTSILILYHLVNHVSVTPKRQYSPAYLNPADLCRLEVLMALTWSLPCLLLTFTLNLTALSHLVLQRR